MTDHAQQAALADHPATVKSTSPAALSPGALSDEQLIALAIADRCPWGWAFTELWHRHDHYVRAFCASRLDGLAEADDVTQNVALKACYALGKFAHRSRFRSWLTGIAITQCAEYRRREARQKNIALKLYAVHDERFVESVALVENEHAVLVDETRRALRSLPPRAREVLIMRFYRDLSLEDMGKELNVGLSAVKMRLYRSINRLRSSYLARMLHETGAA